MTVATTIAHCPRCGDHKETIYINTDPDDLTRDTTVCRTCSAIRREADKASPLRRSQFRRRSAPSMPPTEQAPLLRRILGRFW